MRIIKLITLMIFFSVHGSVAADELDMEMSSAKVVEKLQVANNELSHLISLSGQPKLVVAYSMPVGANLEDIQIILSDDTIVTTSNMEDFGVSIKYVAPSSLLERLLAPADNSVMVIFENTSSVTAKISGVFVGKSVDKVITTTKSLGSDILFGTGITPRFQIYPNDTISVYHLINEGVSPLTSPASVQLKVFQDGQLIQEVALKDDGGVDDYAELDGLYGGKLTLSQSGKYTFEVNSIAVDVNGNSHKNVESKIITVLPTPKYAIEPNFTEELIDTNNNGLADIFRLTFTSNSIIPAGDEYKVRVFIGKGSVQYDSEVVTVNSTTNELVFDFGGKSIWDEHDSGPIEITFLGIYENEGFTTLYYTRSFGQTTNDYLKNQFERNKGS